MAVSAVEHPAVLCITRYVDGATASAAAIATSALLLTRLPVLCAGALAVTVVGTWPPPVGHALWRVAPGELPNLLARWDTFYYHAIAVDGYSWTASTVRGQNVVFFPLYPLLMRWIGAAVGGHPILAGLVISLVAFAGAVALLYKLAIVELGPDLAWRSVLLLVTFPYALFFSAVYTESLFLLLSVGAFYAMRRRFLVWTAVAGVAAGLTRPNGFWLSLPLAILAWTQNPSERENRQRNSDRAMALAVAVTPLLGVAAYSFYLHVRFDDALAWVHGQAAWGLPLAGRPSAPGPTPALQRFDWVGVVVGIGNIIAFALSFVAIRPIARRFGAAYAFWVAVNVGPPVATHLFISLGRFTSVLFPVFFWLAARIPRRHLMPVASGFMATQIVFAMWFFLWRSVT
jgi:hypothetical protein